MSICPTASASDVCYPGDKPSVQEPIAPVTYCQQVSTGQVKLLTVAPPATVATGPLLVVSDGANLFIAYCYDDTCHS